MNAQPSIQRFLKGSGHGWIRHPLTPFACYEWDKSGPPAWHSCGYGSDKVVARAFLGLTPVHRESAFDGLRLVARFFDDEGHSPRMCDIPVLLWDQSFPLPEVAETSGTTTVDCPLVLHRFGASKSVLVILLQYRFGTDRDGLGRWLRSSAIHEGFHALLWDSLGHDRLQDNANGSFSEEWRKFEEMCAMTLEVILARHNGAWREYAWAWQASLAISVSCGQWIGDLSGKSAMSFHCPLHIEEYGHFPFLAWMDEVVWPERARAKRWLLEVWRQGDSKGWMSPWYILDDLLAEDGGLAEVFTRYLQEAFFSTDSGTVLGLLKEEVGPLPAACISPESGTRGFAIGPMSAQLLSFSPGAGRASLVLTGSSIHQCKVDARWVVSDSAGSNFKIFEIELPQVSGKTFVWEADLSAPPANANELRVLVSLPSHRTGSLAFTASVKR